MLTETVGSVRMGQAAHHHPEHWIQHVFSAKAVANGGVIRRSVVWVEHEIGRERFVEEVRGRDFILLETRSQFIVICGPGPVRRVV